MADKHHLYDLMEKHMTDIADLKKQYIAQVLECVFKQIEQQFDQFCEMTSSSLKYRSISDKGKLKIMITRDLAEFTLGVYNFIKEEMIKHSELYDKGDSDIVNDTLICKEDIRSAALGKKLPYSVAKHHPLKSDAMNDINQAIEENLDMMSENAKAKLFEEFDIV